jgi:hypothetical protein
VQLSPKQSAFVSAILQGRTPLEAVELAGYKSGRVDAFKLTHSKKIIAALQLNKGVTAMTTTNTPASFWQPVKIPLIEKFTREECLSALAFVARDTEQPLQARLLALRMLSDLEGWDEKNSSTPITISLGIQEAEL